jgi:hypothetical protein
LTDAGWKNVHYRDQKNNKDIPVPTKTALRASWLLIGACTSASIGCVTPNRIDKVGRNPHEVGSHDEAGSVHIAVLSATPFNRLKSDLQPRFTMDENKALEEVVPNTQLLVERVLDVVQRSLSLSTPQTGTTSTTTISSATGTEPTTTRETTDTRAPGEVPAEATFPGGEQTAAGLTAATPAAPNERAIDPFTKYQAAAALMQEIRVLNQYVVAQELPPEAVAQVVRLQISVLPYARYEPYDVYTNISFFPQSAAEQANKSALLSLETQGQLDDGKGAAIVVPLLATDNFEASSQSSAANSVQQAAISLLGLVQGVGIRAGNGRLLDEIRAVTGRELNALTTTSRLNNNTLRVRLGATFNNQAEYTMVPQTHNVSVVVILPKGTDHVDIIARTTLRHATKGTDLPERPREEAARVACERLRGYRELPGNPLKDITAAYGDVGVCAELDDGQQTKVLSLLQHVEFARFGLFRDTLSGTQPGHDDQITSLWSNLAEILTGSRYSRAWFQVVPEKPTWPAAQTVLAATDDKAITGTVTNGRDLPVNGFSARLYLAKPTAKPTTGNLTCTDAGLNVGADHVELDASTVQVQAGYAGIAVTFPSPKITGDDTHATMRGCIVLTSSTALSPWSDSTATIKSPYFVVIQPKKPDETPKPTLALSVNSIAVDAKAEATVRISVRDRKATDEVYLRVAGAEIVGFEPANSMTLTPLGAKLNVLAAPYVLKLGNVKEDNDITFTLLGKEAKPVLNEVRVDVWALPAAPRAAGGNNSGG